MTKSIHFRGLNGIRAFAAMAVLIAHTIHKFPLFGLPEIKDTSIVIASYGVTMFFTLSGFLITYLILKEKNASGGINIKNFYMRRVLRIWPLYYLYLIACLFLYYFLSIEYNPSSVGFYVFLAANVPLIIGSTLPYAGHLWSIAVEEQFYLFWPWVCKIKNSLFMWLIGLLISFTVLKWLFYFISIKYGIDWPIITISTNRFGSMIAGGILGMLFYEKRKIVDYLALLWVQGLCYLILVLSALNIFHISSTLIDHEIITMVTLCIIVAQIKRKNYIVDLDAYVPDYLGRLSYGIYVYHPLVILILSRLFSNTLPHNLFGYTIVFLSVIVTTILLAQVSYSFFESKFINMKKSFSIIHSKA